MPSNDSLYIDVPRASAEAIAARSAYFKRQRDIQSAGWRELSTGILSDIETAPAAVEDTIEAKDAATAWPVVDSLEISKKRKRIGTTSRNSDTNTSVSAKMARYAASSDSEGETSSARRGRLVRRASSGASSLADDVNRLGADDEITKILGRVRDEAGIYVYTVKLQDGRRVQVSIHALHEYSDIVEAFQEALETGDLKDNIINPDSEGEEGTGFKQRNRKRKPFLGEDDDAKDYDDSEQQEDEDDEGEGASDSDESSLKRSTSRAAQDSDDFVTVGGNKTKHKKHAKTISGPTRRSDREGAKKHVDYSVTAVMDLSDDDTQSSGSEREDTLESSLDPRDLAKSSVPHGMNTNAAPNAEASPSNIADDARAETQADQYHRDECASCSASDAKTLLPLYKTKKGRKRKVEDGEWDEDSIRALGAWILCNTCCQASHWNHLPDTGLPGKLKTTVKYDIAARYNTTVSSKLHLDIERIYRMPGCSDCVRPSGTNCMICKKAESIKSLPSSKITTQQQLPPAPVLPTSSASNVIESSDSHVDITAETPHASTHVTPVKGEQTILPLMFRCQSCKRAAHYDCIGASNVKKWQDKQNWHCNDCVTLTAPDAVLAWRALTSSGDVKPALQMAAPASPTRRAAALSIALPDHTEAFQDAEYLVKFRDESFRHVKWVSHAWLKASYPHRLRNFLVKGPSIDIVPETVDLDEQAGYLETFGLAPSPDAIDRIPKEWLTPDRILEVEYHAKNNAHKQLIPSANLKNLTDDLSESIPRIGRMLVKWQSLPYESATWEDGSLEEQDPYYGDFLRAYNQFLQARKVLVPKLTAAQMDKMDAPRNRKAFEEITEQPKTAIAGTLMPFQLEGVSWLYYDWWIKQGCILADEMGLGKTVQIISFVSLLFKRERCLPFLVVVPNSTLQNWQREFEKWGPSDLRVVPYYGTRTSRKIIEEFELFTDDSVAEQKLRAHVVLTTYESLEKNVSIFRRVQRWESLIVDEAQRLKGGSKGLLWKALRQLRVSHTVLLTGTPVNNNLDELFNLLHFIDPSKFQDLDALHRKYESLTPELVEEVQKLAKPYFLRRTKEEVLDLPPLSEVIVPLSMSPLQRIVYKSVLEKNYDALSAIYDTSKAKSKQKVNRAKVTNVLMELRKTLCHPYLVREELEHESTLSPDQLHRSLVEASSKLVFLAQMLPILRERGHRVLLFSQFVINLNVVERFLEGERIKFVRLDGSTSQNNRQEAIDAYNAPDSDVSVFILSTRAGGVGINLATADTVIIYDADFNPFQDLQAIARAHRIGQKRKVMCFKLMVKSTCEEKIMEQGKKKLVLEQLVVDGLEAKNSDDDDAPNNVESLLLFGAKALFEDNPDEAQKSEIKYSKQDIIDLIRRTEEDDQDIEAVAEKKRKKAEANKAFSYARVWERTQLEAIEASDQNEVEAQRDFWSNMLAAQERARKDEDMARALQTGRGFRQRKTANYYQRDALLDDALSVKNKRAQPTKPFIRDSDPDFDANMQSSDDSDFGDAINGRTASTGLTDAAKQTVNDKSSTYPGNAKENRPPPPIVNSDHPGMNRFEIVRSETPNEIRQKRSVIMQNLISRAQLLGAGHILSILAQAQAAKTGTEQIVHLQRATALLKQMPAGPAFSPNIQTPTGTNGNGPLPR